MILKAKLKKNIRRLLGKNKLRVKILYQGRSKFRKLTVIEDPNSHKRIMYAGNRLFVAGIDTRNGFPINAPYFLTDIVIKKPKSILFIGGGPNAVPVYVWKKYKPNNIDVVERDTLTTLLAKKYFNLPSDPGYSIHHFDVNDYLRNVEKKYDIIYSNVGLTRRRGLSRNDLYNFCSSKGIKTLAEHLTRKGVLVFMIVAKLEGDDSKFVRSCFMRFRRIFKRTYTFSDSKEKKYKTQTIIFLATKRVFDFKDAYVQFVAKGHMPHHLSVYDDLVSRMHESIHFF